MLTALLEHLHWFIFLPLVWAAWKFYTEFFKPSQQLGSELKQATEQLEKLKSMFHDRKISTLVSRHLRRFRSWAPTSNQLTGFW